MATTNAPATDPAQYPSFTGHYSFTLEPVTGVTLFGLMRAPRDMVLDAATAWIRDETTDPGSWVIGYVVDGNTASDSTTLDGTLTDTLDFSTAPSTVKNWTMVEAAASPGSGERIKIPAEAMIVMAAGGADLAGGGGLVVGLQLRDQLG